MLFAKYYFRQNRLYIPFFAKISGENKYFRKNLGENKYFRNDLGENKCFREKSFKKFTLVLYVPDKLAFLY